MANETGEMEEPNTGDVQIFLSSKENSVSMRSIGVSALDFILSDFVSLYCSTEIKNFKFLGGVHVEARKDCRDYDCCFKSEGKGDLCDFDVQELQEHQDSSLPTWAWRCNCSKIL